MLVARNVIALVEAVVTVVDEDLFRWLRQLWIGAGMRLEPSAASSFAAVGKFVGEEEPDRLAHASHVVWTTGGAHLPDAEFEAALARG